MEFWSSSEIRSGREVKIMVKFMVSELAISHVQDVVINYDTKADKVDPSAQVKASQDISK